MTAAYCDVTDTRNSFSADINDLHPAAEDNRQRSNGDDARTVDGMVSGVQQDGLVLCFEFGCD